MSDSDDDMMPGLGSDTKVAEAGGPVDEDLAVEGAAEAEVVEMVAVKAEPELPDVVVESSTAGGNAVVKSAPVPQSALKKKVRVKKIVKVVTEEGVDAPAVSITLKPKAAEHSGDTLNLMSKLHTLMRQEQPKPVKREVDAARAAAAEVKEEARPLKNQEYLSVHTDKKRFIGGWAEVVRQFAEDPNQLEYVCPTDLNGYDRKLLHSLAEEFNLGHKSRGQGPERRLVLSKDRLFYSLGGTTVGDKSLKALENWQDMTKRFTPNMAAPQKPRDDGEYVPGETSDLMAESGQAEREEEDRMTRSKRLQTFRRMNQMGCFLEAGEEDAVVPRADPGLPRLPDLPARPTHGVLDGMIPPPGPIPNAFQAMPVPQGFAVPIPFAAPFAGAPPVVPPMPGAGAKRKRDDDGLPPAAKKEKKEAPVDDAMQKFLKSGLAPRTVAIKRSPGEPLGLRFTKELLVTAVTGPSERCNVPVDMFINEVDGADVNTPNEFTQAIKNKQSFTVTLWFLRKDGYTVQKLKDIAREAEEMLQRAVEGDAGSGVTLMQTCTICESSVPLVGEAWEGEKTLPCPGCGKPTPWIVESLEDDDEEDEEDD
eukprot:TRINITY_DN5266_c1_g1_i1.p1 TRINITY_DN5266_c1_g1~~TRINITY_DN5266_c1_g1_i1.p1  ORF type:complete len:592 (+),score=244.23 TRINITY_DN5266_c1_g1_i1:91-1866(+)